MYRLQYYIACQSRFKKTESKNSKSTKLQYEFFNYSQKHPLVKFLPVMLAKETGINLPIFIPQCLSRPEWKAFEFSPDQRMRIALEEEVKHT